MGPRSDADGLSGVPEGPRTGAVITACERASESLDSGSVALQRVHTLRTGDVAAVWIASARTSATWTRCDTVTSKYFTVNFHAGR